MIDEAHERTTNTDLLLALPKKLVSKRKDLKIVIMSATINLERFLDHIVTNKPKGNILVFMTSTREIERTCAELRTQLPELKVLPMYSSLPEYAQDMAISGSTSQTCNVSTDVAEASLTIPGVVCVVDCGLHKEASYNPRVGMSTLATALISQASARQRAGRAGRTKPGECYRLYTKEFHDRGMTPNTPPAVHLSELSSEVLLLKSLGFHDIPKFDWLDPPHPEPYLRASVISETWATSTIIVVSRDNHPSGLDPLSSLIRMNHNPIKNVASKGTKDT
ncbi:P-loop containing nucleoside triphosphate hydrolase protein [Fusarium avenaceum]|nr:P-loop containing nucleoside triphosphate hydrolase protein [Fusarium avenaceum]